MTKHVDFLNTLDGGSQEVVLTVAVRGGRLAVVRGDRRLANVAEMVDLIQRIPGYEAVTLEDGDRFLQGLHLAYSGSRFRATRPYDMAHRPRPGVRAAPGQS